MEDDEEEYVLFGTPLPEIEDEATLKKKAAKELQVRDEKGRQRFHGAFTGGFSAGYFNTVDTKEGWAPSTFISSRDKKSDRLQQNPEDFMDDEDFGEFGIATRKIHTTTNFQDLSNKKEQKRKFNDSDSVIPGEAPLKDLVKPVRESIGIIILKKLGWREGQGIGPRVKKVSKGSKFYGCSPFPDKDVSEEEDPMASLFTFAPEDIESLSYKPKDNYFGLCYTGLSKESVLSAPIDLFASTSTKSWLAKDKKKIQISGQAFGVGAFEDEDADIYGKDDMSQYDFSELEVKKPEHSLKAIENSKHEKFQGVLDGFQLAKHPPLLKEYYPPPTLPSNFKPIHLKIACVVPQQTNVGQSRHNLTASDRSMLLGERKFQKVSLNDPAENRKKLEFDEIQSQTSSATSKSFRPFSNDIAKEQRYAEYLKLKQTGDISKLAQPLSMTEWEKQQEIEEFSKSSVLFKPLSNALSSRFESRSNLSAEHDVMAAIEKVKKDKKEKPAVSKKCLVGKSNRKTFEWHPVSLLCKRMNIPNPYPNSDPTGSGKIVQSKSVFSHLNFTFENLESSAKSSCSLPTDSSVSTAENTESNTDLPDKSQNEIFDNADKSNEEALSIKHVEGLTFEGKKPPMDFFKDIFENSSSDEDDPDEEKLKASNRNSSERKLLESKTIDENLKTDSRLHNPFDKEAINSTDNKDDHRSVASASRNSSVSKKAGFGVFANLDLDALNVRKPAEKVRPDVSKSKDEVVEGTSVNSNVDEPVKIQPKTNDIYGPALPPNYSTLDSPDYLPSSNSTSLKKHSKSKSRHKHKHHKHKHKKKKKKSSKRSSDSSDLSEEELDDIPPSLIIEKMKKLQKKFLEK